MAGDLKRFVFEERENTRRYNANIDAIIEKYGKPSKYVDIVDLDNMEITTSKGMLRKQQPRHFGHTRLHHTKRQEESILIQEDNSLLSYSMTSAPDSESTDYGSKQLNSSGGSFVPRLDVRRSGGDSWLDKSRRSHRGLGNSPTEQESKHPNQGLDTFSLAEQVDDSEDAGELLSLQETMLTFIENEHGEPSDAETLSSSSSTSNNQWQDDSDVIDNEDLIRIKSDKSEIDSDKSDVGDNTIGHQRNGDFVDKWIPQKHREMGEAWLDRKEDQFTLISSSQDSGISNLHDGIRSSDGVEWAVSPRSPLTKTHRWEGNNTHHHVAATHRGRPALPAVDPMRSTERQCTSSSRPTVDKQENRKKSPKTTIKVLRSPVKRSSAQQTHDSDEVDGDITGMKVSHGALHKNQQRENDFRRPSWSTKMQVPWHYEDRLAQPAMPNDLIGNRDYNTNHVEFNGRPESKLQRTEGVVKTEGQSRPLVKNSQLQRSRTPLPNTTNRTKSFEELVSKSVPSKLMIQNLKDLPRGKLSASNMSKDPLTSMEKVYRWLSPPTMTSFSDQRHKVNARRRLQLATSSSDNVVWEDKVNTYDNNKLGVRFIREEQKDNTDCLEQMDSINTDIEMDIHHREVETKGRLMEQQPMMQQKALHQHSAAQRLTTACNSGRNLNSPEKQNRSSGMWEDQYVSYRQPVTPNTDKRQWKSPHGTRQGFQNRSPWQSPNTTPRRNRGSLFCSEVTSSPQDSMSPNSNSPWRSRSCGQRFHPYSRKNPDSPSAIFARLKLSISSPSSSREGPVQQKQDVVEIPNSSKVKRSANVPSPGQPTRNHGLGNEIASPTKSWQQLKQIEKFSTSDRSSEEIFHNNQNLYHTDVSGKFQPKNLFIEPGRNISHEKPSRKHETETMMSSNRDQYVKRSTSKDGHTRSFDLFDTLDLESSSQRTTASKGQHLSKLSVRAQQNDQLNAARKYTPTQKSTCRQDNSSSPNQLYSTYNGSKVQHERKVHDSKEQNYRSQKSTQTISPFRNAKHSSGQDFSRKKSCQTSSKQDKSVPKDEAAGVENSRQRFLSPTRWKGPQENDCSNLFSSLPDSGVDCSYKGHPDHLEAKHGVISNIIRSNVHDRPLQSTCESPLVKISSKPKAVTPGSNTSVQTASETRESSQRSYVKCKKSGVVDRTGTFKQPMGAFVSLRDKVLANNQRHSSTPMKHTPEFLLNDTLSTIHATNSDNDSDSSDEMVLTISPSY